MVLVNEGADELVRHLNGRISIAAVVCADASLAHESAAAKLGFPLKELVTSSGQHVLDGIFHIQHVDGIDFSARFISAATELQKSGSIKFFVPAEGELGDYKKASRNDFACDIEPERVLFTQGDACNLKAKTENPEMELGTKTVVTYNVLTLRRSIYKSQNR